ncbi:MAG: hypothetical protein QG657_4062 [Acidobacteriota bacterium]|nr:hypothetical protein [Acidobacteriota bacterium]
MIDPNLLIDREEAFFEVEKFEFNELVTYIEKRLRRESILPPLDTRSDELPEYFLEKLYEHSRNEVFKSRFRKAVTVLLCHELPEISDNDYLATLLVLCEEYIIEEAITPVSGLALSGKLKRKKSGYGDLHRQALLALARLPEGLKMTDIWVNSITDPRYTAAAFAALRTQRLDIICKYLPLFIRMTWEHPDCLDINIGIKTIYEEYQEDYSEEEITQMLINCGDENNDEIRRELNNIIADLNKNGLPPVTNEEDWLFEYTPMKNYLLAKLTRKNIDPENAHREIVVWKWIAEKENKRERASRWENVATIYS